MGKRWWVLGAGVFMLILIVQISSALTLTLMCTGEGKSDERPFTKTVTGGDSVSADPVYSCEGPLKVLASADGGSGWCSGIPSSGDGYCVAYTLDFDSVEDHCAKYGASSDIGRSTVFDDNMTTGMMCCGDDMPGDTGSDAADNPDNSEIFCNGGIKYSGAGRGCPVGRWSQYDPLFGGSSLTSKRAWGGNLEATDSTFGSLACCGDDYGDEGLIFSDDTGLQFVCDAEGTTRMEWRPADHVRAGGVYEVKTVPDLFDPEILDYKDFPLFTEISDTKDVYDVLGGDGGSWFVCDDDSSLSERYTKGNTFSSEGEPCDGESIFDCKDVKDSDFVCYTSSKEEIAECHAGVAKNNKFTAGSGEELNDDDESTGFVWGKIIPSPFSEDLHEFNKVGDVCAYDLCTFLFTDLDLKLDEKPEVLDWTPYDALHFNIFFENAGKSDLITLTIKGKTTFSEPLSSFYTGSREVLSGIWYHVIIPKPYLPSGNITEFTMSAEDDVGRINLHQFFLAEPKGALFCGRQTEFSAGQWLLDLDNDEASGGKACDSQQDLMYWTGTRCCGDDYSEVNSEFGYKSEFYLDTKGSCFASRKLPLSGQADRIKVTSSTSNETSFRVLGDAVSGKLLGCNAVGGYSWVLDVEETDDKGDGTGKKIVETVSDCDVRGAEGEGSYYCGPDGWSDDSYSVSTGTVYAFERSSKVADPDGITAGCCRVGDCWTGTACKGTQEDEVSGSGSLPSGVTLDGKPKPGDVVSGSRCIAGEWTESELQWDWLDSEYGFCPDAESCLLDPSIAVGQTATQVPSACKPSAWYSRSTNIAGVVKKSNFKSNSVQGLYCNKGTWSSRTHIIAQKLMGSFEDGYTLTCGPYHDVLVNEGKDKKAYIEGFLGGITPVFTNRIDKSVFNNLCILNKDGEIVIGSSYNALGSDVSIPEASQISLKTAVKESFDYDLDVSGCLGSVDEFDFKYCGSGFYWNNKTESFIYAPSGTDVLSAGSAGSLYDYIIEKVKSFFGATTTGFHEIPPTPLGRARVFDDIYVAKFGSKSIVSVKEAKTSESGDIHSYFTVQFSGFSGDVCASVNAYDKSRDGHAKDTIICEASGDKATVFAVADSTSLIPVPKPEFFRAITRELRPK